MQEPPIPAPHHVLQAAGRVDLVAQRRAGDQLFEQIDATQAVLQASDPVAGKPRCRRAVEQVIEDTLREL
jgi:hypothetical protein